LPCLNKQILTYSSQWGHNFRVSYLRLRTLVSKLKPRSILALTATAGPPVIKDICHTLHVPMKITETEDQMEDGTKVLSCNRDNIDIVVEFTSNEDERLTKVSLKGIHANYLGLKTS
jgi:Superfamily II DNA helicase